MTEQKIGFSPINSQIDSSVSKEGFEFIPVGNLVLKSGILVGCDPYSYPEEKPFEKTFPPGSYPVTVLHDIRDSCIFVRFKNTIAVHWENAARIGEKLENLQEGEYFSYCVDRGTGSFMDAETAKILCKYKEAERVMPWDGTHPFHPYYYANYYDELDGENFSVFRETEASIAEELSKLTNMSGLVSYEEWLKKFLAQESAKDETEVISDTDKLTQHVQSKTKANEDIVSRLVMLQLEIYIGRHKTQRLKKDFGMETNKDHVEKSIIPSPIELLEHTAANNPEKHSRLIKLWEKEINMSDERLKISIDKAGWRERLTSNQKIDLERISQYKNVVVDSRSGLNFIACNSGWGDGCYPSFYGYDDTGEICVLVTDFLNVGFPDVATEE
jgi:hypothetical protein